MNLETIWLTVEIASGVFVGLFILIVAGTYIFTTLLAFPELIRMRRWARTYHTSEALAASSAPPITLIAPMWNEGMVCVEATRALLGVDYPNLEVMVVNDGSTDDTVAKLTEAFDLHPATRPATAHIDTAPIVSALRSRRRPDLWVINKENGGRSDAVNVGLNHCRTPLVCTLDGDSLLGDDALLRAVRPFLEDSRTVAVGGTIGIVNDCDVRMGRVSGIRLPKKWVARFQVLEYIRAFAAARVGWASVGALPLISGAFGLFSRDAMVTVGGLERHTIGEDFEMTMKLHRYHRDRKIPYRIAFAADAVSWTECPDTWKVLGKQRDRWQRGGMEVIEKHKSMLFNRKYGRIGFFSLPSFLIVELMTPCFEAIGYVGLIVGVLLGLISGTSALLLLGLMVALGIAQSLSSIAFEQLAFRRYRSLKDVLVLLSMAVIENFGYHQVMLYHRVKGFIKFFRGDTSWGEMTRTGFATEEPVA